MESQDNAVENQVESTTSIDSAPIETETPSTPNEPADALVEPEKKVSDVVPRDRLNEVIAERNQLRQMLESQPVPPQPQYDAPQLDPEAATAVEAIVERKYEAKRAEDFARKYATELSDPIIRATVVDIIQNENRAGRRIDQEDALNQAKKLLDERLKPVVQDATKQAFNEGQNLGIAKLQNGAIGETNQVAPVMDDDSLSSEEYARKYNLSTQ